MREQNWYLKNDTNIQTHIVLELEKEELCCVFEKAAKVSKDLAWNTSEFSQATCLMGCVCSVRDIRQSKNM